MATEIGHSNTRLELRAGSGTAAARQSVSVAEADRAKRHHLAFGIYGAPGDGARLKVGTTEGGEELYRGHFNPGHHIVVFTPNTGTIYVQFEKPGGYNVQIDDVKFLDDEALELVTPWVQNAVSALRFAQSNDIMTVTHRDFQPCDIVRTAENAFSVEFFPSRDGPYLDENTDDDLTLTLAASSGGAVNVTAASDLFKDTDVWRHLTIKHGDTWGWALIRSVTSATVAVIEVKRAFGEATATPAWRLGAWNEAVGYPAAVAYHDGRQVFAGGNTRRLQRRIDASAQPGFNVFTPGAGDDADAWTRELAAQGAIRHLVSGRQLIVLTTDEERALSGDGDRDPITPSAFRDTSIGRRGASDPTPIALGTVTLFVDGARRALVELTYDALTEGYEGPDMLLLAQHLTNAAAGKGLVELTHVRHPWTQLLAARDDGALLAFTYLREEQVTGWSRFLVANGKGAVESVTAIPGAPDDEVWLIVKYDDGEGRPASSGTPAVAAGSLETRFDSLADFTGLFALASSGTDRGAWIFDATPSTPSSNTGPGDNGTGGYVHTETSGGGDFGTRENNGVATLDMAQFTGRTGRALRLRACVQGDFDNDDDEGLRVQWRADDADDWTTALLVNGWAYSDSHEAGDTITQYRTGASLVCAADGGWVDFEADIPDEANAVRLAPRLIGGSQITHDIALYSATLEWAAADGVAADPGSLRRHVERLEPGLLLDEDPRRAFYVDSGLTLDSPEAAALTPGAATGDGVAFTAGADVFEAGDVGRFIHYAYVVTGDDGLPEPGDDGLPVWKVAAAEITAFVSATEVTAAIGAEFPSTAPIAAGAWHMTVTQISGLGHLEGETVAVHADGRRQADRTVAGGAIMLEAPAAIVHVGRRYSWRWTMLPLEPGARQGTAQGRQVNVVGLLARVVRTRGLKIGAVGSLQFDAHAFEAPAAHQPDPLFTGDVERPGFGFRKGLTLKFGDDGTYPAVMTLVVPRSDVGEAT